MNWGTGSTLNLNTLYVCLYVLTDREWTKCQKRPFWGENKMLSKMYEKMYESNNFFKNSPCSVTDAAASGKRSQLLTTLHAKLFLFLRVLPVWWNSIIDDRLSAGPLEKLNNWVASISIWLQSILWVRMTKGTHFFNVGNKEVNIPCTMQRGMQPSYLFEQIWKVKRD